MKEFFSHLNPDIRLKDHLQIVGENGKKILLEKQLNNLDKNLLSDIAYLVGISHDFGKFTQYFQDYLYGRTSESGWTHHGLISALFTFEVLSEFVRIKNAEDHKIHNYLPLFGYFIVKHHHGNLNDINSDVESKDLIKEFNFIREQLLSIKKSEKEIEEIYNGLFQGYGLNFPRIISNLYRYGSPFASFQELDKIIKPLRKLNYEFTDSNSKKENREISFFLITLLLYSILIDSDKKHAGDVRKIERKELLDNLVETHLNKPKIKEENKSNINIIRSQIQESVIKNISDPKNASQKIFTLTAPTGTGKTLTSFAAALKLRKILKNSFDLEYEPRIIYSLPFTSIIDQNYDVFDKVLSQIGDFKNNESPYLLKHHHLSEIFYKTQNMDKEEDLDESLALIESWESEVIVTTFIQLFYSLIGYKNRSLKKFHNTVNSIIILDEAQNIPIEYWNLVRRVLIGMTEYFNCRIILMTATKPLIFERGEYKELVDNYESYFKTEDLNRVILKIDSKEKKVIEFCNELNDWSKNSYLFVFNTIGSSLEFYNLITDKIQKSGLPFKKCYLSTNITPRERRQRIEYARKAIKNNQKVIIVSTQLIEAGVDIDCDCVYRDRGPLDSIIQVAGRCNRNKRFDKAEIHLVNLKNGTSYTRIYDPVLLDIVDKLFNNEDKYTSQIYEINFLDLINQYFERAKEKSATEVKLIEALYDLYFYDKDPDKNKRRPISDFKLIDDNDFYKVDIFVELDDEFLFSWDEIPGNHNGKLIEILNQNFAIDCLEKAKIEKNDDDKTIKLTTENNSVLLKLNFEKTKATLTIDGNEVDEFVLKVENGKLNVYDDNAKKVKQKYCEIRDIKDPLKRRKEFLKIKKQFYDYVISIPKNYAAHFKEEELGFINNYELKSYYDSKTGFKREKAGCGNLIC
ncbi:MAG: CRISPR-associated helicase Cas3' [Candidatus Methanoperedens sp.]|nr:CRISPR-associated helicase Cas3' [Candidatus Methanoperedens sp.]